MSPAVTAHDPDAQLARLRRSGLIRDWTVDHDTDQRTVTIGRSNIGSLKSLAPIDVELLAERLHRDVVKTVGRGYPVGYRNVRYHLDDGRFADRSDTTAGRYIPDHPYTVYLPGGEASGSAAPHFAARTLREATALAGFKRVLGRCLRCDTLRPLHVDRWRPDPRIPCPGCESTDTRGPLIMPCRRCPLDVEPHTSGTGTLFTAWRHVSGAVLCADRKPRPGSFRALSAQPR